MPRAILLYRNNKGIVEKHWINLQLKKEGPGIGTFRLFDISKVEGNTCYHEHYMGNVYEFEIPFFEGRELLQSFGDMRTSHTNNKQRFSVRKPRDTWFFRIEFHNVELCDRFQIVALYDGGLNPKNLDTRIFNDIIPLQRVRISNIY